MGNAVQYSSAVDRQRISFTHETSSRGSKGDVTVAVSQRILRSSETSPGG
jgi:hypothetical protein